MTEKTRIEYFLEIIGEEDWLIESVLVGCDECGKRLRADDVPAAKQWKAEHHRLEHNGHKYRMHFTADDPFHEAHKHNYRANVSGFPVRDDHMARLKEWKSIPELAAELGKSESYVKSTMWRYMQDGLVLQENRRSAAGRVRIHYLAG